MDKINKTVETGNVVAADADTDDVEVDTDDGDGNDGDVAGKAGGVDGDGGARTHKREVVGIFDRAAPDYDGQGVSFFSPLGVALVAAAGVRAGDDVIDFACGRGAVLFPAADAAGSTGSVRAFDLAPAMVRLTGAEAARRGLDHVSVTLGDAEYPTLPPGCADVIVCGLGLFLLPDAAGALARWAALLRPGGRLAVSVFGALDPVWDGEDFPLRRFAPRPESTHPQRADILAPGALEAAMSAAGLVGVAERRIDCDVVLRDVEHWWAWGWGTGYRWLLEKIPPAAKPDLVAELTTYLEPVTDQEGPHWRPTIRIVSAHLPESD